MKLGLPPNSCSDAVPVRAGVTLSQIRPGRPACWVIADQSWGRVIEMAGAPKRALRFAWPVWLTFANPIWPLVRLLSVRLMSWV